MSSFKMIALSRWAEGEQTLQPITTIIISRCRNFSDQQPHIFPFGSWFLGGDPLEGVNTCRGVPTTLSSWLLNGMSAIYISELRCLTI